MIKADDAIYFRAGQIKREGDLAHSFLADMAKYFLDIVQNWQKRALFVLMPGQDVSD